MFISASNILFLTKLFVNYQKLFQLSSIKLIQELVKINIVPILEIHLIFDSF